MSSPSHFVVFYQRYISIPFSFLIFIWRRLKLDLIYFNVFLHLRHTYNLILHFPPRQALRK
jgi:hypothetical protein